MGFILIVHYFQISSSSTPSQLFTKHAGFVSSGEKFGCVHNKHAVITIYLLQTCVCIWKNGKETVECINRDLGEIPDGVEPSTQVTVVDNIGYFANI